MRSRIEHTWTLPACCRLHTQQVISRDLLLHNYLTDETEKTYYYYEYTTHYTYTSKFLYLV